MPRLILSSSFRLTNLSSTAFVITSAYLAGRMVFVFHGKQHTVVSHYINTAFHISTIQPDFCTMYTWMCTRALKIGQKWLWNIHTKNLKIEPFKYQFIRIMSTTVSQLAMTYTRVCFVSSLFPLWKRCSGKGTADLWDFLKQGFI